MKAIVVGIAAFLCAINQTSAQRPSAGLNATQIKFIMGECGAYRHVYGVMASSADKATEEFGLRVLDSAAKFAEADCPRGGYANIDVDIFYGEPAGFTADKFRLRGFKSTSDQMYAIYGSYNHGNTTMHARNYKSGLAAITWEEYSNRGASSRRSAELSAKDAAEQSVAANQQRAALQKQKQQRAAVIAQHRIPLIARYGAFQPVSITAVEPNPFAWKGKQIGLCAYFERMVSANMAQITSGSSAYVTGVPSTRFVSPRAVFLIARVEGLVEGTSRLSLRYVAAVDLGAGGSSCSDYMDQ